MLAISFIFNERTTTSLPVKTFSLFDNDLIIYSLSTFSSELFNFSYFVLSLGAFKDYMSN